MRETVLLATLGTEAQVVTAAWKLLRGQGVSFQSIEVFFTQAPAVAAARTRLENAAHEHPNFPRPIFTLLGADLGHPLQDVITSEDSRAAFTTIYRRLQTHKSHGRQVHFLIAGGRKPLALFGMATAQLLFDEDDHLWHLYSAGEFLQSKRLFPHPQDQVALVPLPVVPWHRLTPSLMLLEGIDDPWEAVEKARRLSLEERMDLADRFVRAHLTDAERRVVSLLVREGLSDRALAEHLVVSEKTVGNHLSSVYTKAADFLGVERMSRGQLIAFLHLYFVAQAPQNEDFSP